LNINLLDIGSEISINSYIDYQYEQIATAKISYIENTLYQNDDISNTEIYDKYKYKGFWNQNSNNVLIEGMTTGTRIISLGNDFYNISGISNHNNIISKNDFITFKYEFSINTLDYNHIFDGDSSYTIIRFTSSGLDGDVYNIINNSTIINSMILINDTIYYIKNIIETENTNEYNMELCKIYSEDNVNNYINTGNEILANIELDIVLFIFNQIQRVYVDKIQLKHGPKSYWHQLLNKFPEFYIITSPWVDIVTNKTIIQNIDENPLAIENNFITSKCGFEIIHDNYLPFVNKQIFKKIHSSRSPYYSFSLSSTEFNMYTYTGNIPHTPRPGIDYLGGVKIIGYEKYGTNTHKIYLEYIMKNKYLKITNEGNAGSRKLTFQEPEPGLTIGSNIKITNVNGSGSKEMTGKIIGVDDTFKEFDLDTDYTHVQESFLNNAIYYCSDIGGEYGVLISKQLLGNINSYINNNNIFWNYNIVNSMFMSGGSMETTLNYGSATELKQFNIAYHSSKYRRVFIDDFKFITNIKDNIKELFNEINNRHLRIVMGGIDSQGEFQYYNTNIIEKAIRLHYDKGIEYVDGKMLKYFNNLSIPYVSKINQYVSNTNVNLPTKCENVNEEGAIKWEKFNFSENEKILGISQAYGEKEISSSKYEMPTYIKTRVQHENVIYHLYIRPEFTTIKYRINHQGYIDNNGFGELGINIRHYPNSKYVQEINFYSGSNGIGHFVGKEQVFIKNNIEKIIAHAMGMKYYFNMNFESDIINDDNSLFFTDDGDYPEFGCYYKSGEYEISTYTGCDIFYENDIGNLIIFKIDDNTFKSYLITKIKSDTSVEVLEQVDELFRLGDYTNKKISPNDDIECIRTSVNSETWLPYINNYTFNIPEVTLIMSNDNDIYINNAIGFEIIIPQGAEIHLTQHSPITLSLYKQVSSLDSENNNIQIDNVEYNGALHPFRSIYEMKNKENGSITGYEHTPILYPGSVNFKEVKYLPEIYVDYDYILPEVAHIYLNDNGNFNYTKYIPEKYDYISPIIQHDNLYIGTVSIPPKIIVNNKEYPFMSTGHQLFNHNKKVNDYFNMTSIKKEVKDGKSQNTLLEIYNLERRDLYFSTSKKHIYWEFYNGDIVQIDSIKLYIPKNINTFNIGDTIAIFNNNHNAGIEPSLTANIINIDTVKKIITLDRPMEIVNNLLGIKRENSINNIQYLMNSTKYSIFKYLINNTDNNNNNNNNNIKIGFTNYNCLFDNNDG